MNESHTGYNIKINEFNLVHKVLTISLDNASTNYKAMSYIMSDVIIILDGTFLHVRCCAHIIYLTA